MTIQQEFIEMSKERLTQMKVLLDELQLQLSLGRAEAVDIFDRERKNFQQFIRDYKEQLRQENLKTVEHRDKLVRKMEELENALETALATSKKKFEQDKKSVLHAIYELESELRETYGELGQTLQDRLDSFKGRLDAYRVQLALAEYDAKDELEEKKMALRNSVNSLIEKIRNETSVSERVDHFSSEVNQSMDHLRKAFSDLFS
ncbi:MAG: hypothetical protein RLY31_2919 [Bacteroidota bacterium]